MSKRLLIVGALLMGAMVLSAAGDSDSVPVYDRFGVKRNDVKVQIAENLEVGYPAFVESVSKSGTPVVLFEFKGKHGASYALQIKTGPSQTTVEIPESSQFEGSFTKSLPMGTLGEHRNFMLNGSK